ncbi:MAG: amidohydrolase family protein [Actinomycetota bacterium]|nr:amidohydrolase family protein [Actinomycetota bacterium]
MRCLAAGRVLTGDRGTVIEDGAVVVDDTTIVWVGQRSKLPDRFRSAEAVDLGDDATLLPGLIDSHVHLGFDGGPDPVARMKAETDAEQLVLMLRSARELLSVGVTTARDLGARSFLDVTVRDAIASGMARGPRMITAGRPITVTGGHCWFMGGECDTVDDVRTMVRLHHKMGVDCIKVMSTGGFMTKGSAPWFAQFTGDQLTAAVEEAHRVGKRVAAHAHGVEGIRRAVEAQVDTIEHCSFVHPDGGRAIDMDLVDAIVGSAIWVCPTINLKLPALMAARGPDWTPALVHLHARGARIIAGTDSGINNTPHHGYVGGLEAMALLGMPNEDILHAATAEAADALGVGLITGRLTEGLDADVIAVGGDPLADLAVLRDLRLVMTRGCEFTPDPVPDHPPVGGPKVASPS